VWIDKRGEDAAAVGFEDVIGWFEETAVLRLRADKRNQAVIAPHDGARSDLDRGKVAAATS
jgi:hypothetical protein